MKRLLGLVVALLVVAGCGFALLTQSQAQGQAAPTADSGHGPLKHFVFSKPFVLYSSLRGDAALVHLSKPPAPGVEVAINPKGAIVEGQAIPAEALALEGVVTAMVPNASGQAFIYTASPDAKYPALRYGGALDPASSYFLAWLGDNNILYVSTTSQVSLRMEVTGYFTQ